eukprot:TRINITY_DN35025_c0_g1_i1.p1 TRINITY_DN35025_c0_g1~~TRINITY_DN35025_c0_g1_i1.p1  ORF type:complete len:258 (+),score=61.35 TRINITY_DN35025_c0_g1_i1:72-845(+)
MAGTSDTEAFLWTMDEARSKAVSQSGASNCGATALLNVLKSMNVPVPDIRSAEKAVRTNSRKYGVSTSEYLAARCVAGCTGENIVDGCVTVAGEAVESRFFAFYPPREVDPQRWLAGWFSRGCSAVATLNTQRMYDADYWHHQMIFGVSDRGAFMTNGVGVMGYAELMTGLESPSVLQIYKSDALDCKPFDPEKCDQLGTEWAELKVTEQLQDLKSGKSDAKYVYIPAAYRAGITIFAKKGTPAQTELQQAPELPLK